MGTSAAQRDYNLETFQKSVNKPEIVKVPQVKIAPKVSTFKIIAIVALFILCASSYLYGRVKLNELNSQFSEITAKTEILQSEKVRLDMALNEKMSVKNIEEYAKTTLGLCAPNVSQIEYIVLNDDTENVQAQQPNKGFFESVRKFVSELWSKLQP